MAEKRKQFYGFDVLKFIMAVLVAARHMIQVFFPESSPWRLLVGSWLSNLAVPVFLVIAGFLLFRKVPEPGTEDWRATGRRTVFKYCMRILKLYLLWCVLYWPIDTYNYLHGVESLGLTIRNYIKSFFFSSTIAQLWYLPALLVACLIVWLCYSATRRIWPVLLVTGALFVMGCLGDNWYFNQRLPMAVQQVLFAYLRHCVTMRNGVFYGAFYVAIGLFFARKKWRLPFLVSAVGAALSIGLMYKEVVRCSNTNMTFMAVPAACFLVEAALAVNWKEQKFCPRLRIASEWIYLFHFYIFYVFSWTAPFNPIPLTEKNIALLNLIPLVLFAWMMACLSERYKWLKKLI